MSELLQVSPKMLVVKERSLGVPMDMGLVLSMILEAGASWPTENGNVLPLRRGNTWPKVFCSQTLHVYQTLLNPIGSPDSKVRLSSLTCSSPLP